MGVIADEAADLDRGKLGDPKIAKLKHLQNALADFERLFRVFRVSSFASRDWRR